MLPDGTIVFVETFCRRVSAFSADRGLYAYGDTGGAPTACVAGSDGIYVAQNGRTAGPWLSPRPTPPSIMRVGADGEVSIVAEAASGEPLLGPNDLAFGPDGCLYFTDPGTFDPDQSKDGRICCLQPDGTATIVEHLGGSYPNGILIEADGSIVWTESFTRRVRRRLPAGGIETLATLPEDRIPDGLEADAEGRLYVTGVTSGGIDILAPNGELSEFVPTAGPPLNCVFDGSALFVTELEAWTPELESGAPVMNGKLTRLELGVRGRERYRGSIG